MWKRFLLWLTKGFETQPGYLEERYEAKLRETEESLNRLQEMVINGPCYKNEFLNLKDSFEDINRMLFVIEDERLAVLHHIEREFPEISGQYKNVSDAVTYLIGKAKCEKINEST